VKKNNIKVVLSGEGADELFGGYLGYRLDARRPNSPYGRNDCDEMLEKELRCNLWGLDSFFYEKNYHEFSGIKRSLYSDELNEIFEKFDSAREGIVDKAKIRGRNISHIRSYLDFKFRVSDHLCADHGDRMSYANSVEARYPFLDIELIEFIKTMPAKIKFSSITEKYILKKCARKYVPSSIIDREKFSFVAPGSQFLLSRDLEWVNDMLSFDRIKRQGIFNPDTIENLKRMYRGRNFSLNQTFETDLLMIVLTFGIFQDLFQVKNS
jgi:asparagine synthase (glutamine-hydrolysing)